MIRGVDVSNWQGTITPDQAACFKAAGIEHVVVRASLESMALVATAKEQIAAFQTAGIDVSLYVWAYFVSYEPNKTIADLMREYGRFGITRVWIDCEETGDVSKAPANNALWLRTAISALEAAGMIPGIYSAAWWWNVYMAGVTQFHSYPLWVASYDHQPTLDGWTRFGGWTAALGKQYEDKGSLCGISPLDLDVFDDSILPAPKPRPMDPATVRGWLDEVDQWERDSAAVAAASQTLRAARLAEMRAAVEAAT